MLFGSSILLSFSSLDLAAQVYTSAAMRFCVGLSLNTVCCISFGVSAAAGAMRAWRRWPGMERTEKPPLGRMMTVHISFSGALRKGTVFHSSQGASEPEFSAVMAGGSDGVRGHVTGVWYASPGTVRGGGRNRGARGEKVLGADVRSRGAARPRPSGAAAVVVLAFSFGALEVAK